MKKKIALFLAAVMALGPVSVFANSTNTLVNQPSNVSKDTVLFENSSFTYSQLLNLFPEGYDEAEDDEKMEYSVNGPDLEIEMGNNSGDKLNENDVFKVDLVNAEWFFRNTRDFDYVTANANVYSYFIDLFEKYAQLKNVETSGGSNYSNVTKVNGRNLGTGNLAAKDFEAKSGSIITTEEIAYIYNTFIAPFPESSVTGVAGAVSAGLTAFGFAQTTGTPEYPQFDDDFDGEGFERQAGISSQYTSLDFYNKLTANFKDAPGKISTYDVMNGFYVPSLKTYYRFDIDGVIYSLKIEGSDNNKGIVRMYRNWTKADGELVIPIVSRAKEDGEVRVQIARDGNYTSVSAGDMQIATVSKTKTDTYVTNKINAKYSFPLKDLEVKEVNTGSLQPGYIEFKAPDGFYFSDPTQPATINEDGDKEYIRFIAEGTLEFRGNTSELRNSSGTTYISYGLDDDGKIDKSKIRINTDGDVSSANAEDKGYARATRGLGIISTTQTAGKLIIKNVVLLADDYAPMGDVVLKVKGKGVTEQDFTIGARSEWGVEFKTLTDPTKLVNGRLTPAYAKGIDNTKTSAYISGNSTFDKEHKTARVKISENVIASWWGLRETEFTLPTGVKFMQAKISNESNLDHINNNYKLNGEYALNDTKTSYVTLNANKLKINDVQIKRDKTASFEMDIWVSIESGWEGDIMLTAGGNDLLDEVAPLKIATAVSPITVKAEVKDVKIGYQWQKVADVIITETEVGMLQKDRSVVLSIDDNITGSDNIAFAPDFVTEINTDSKIAFSKPAVNGGKINFTIERASTGKPASIKFSNMYVKIDRTVPETNKRPYSVVVGGTAVAANYYENIPVNSIKSIHPLFSVKGIGADYINVVTSATNASSLFSNVVRVTIGSNEIKIGRDGASQTLTMDTAAYISTSNSTMVPVRFVSQAFGLPDSQILWDEEARTVTILGGPNGTVQLKIGSDQITVGGATYTMYSPDNPPKKVSAEIKDNRSFLPFRQLGNALGVEVSWDEATKTAIYNPQLLED